MKFLGKKHQISHLSLLPLSTSSERTSQKIEDHKGISFPTVNFYFFFFFLPFMKKNKKMRRINMRMSGKIVKITKLSNLIVIRIS